MKRIDTPEGFTVDSFVVHNDHGWAAVFMRYGEDKSVNGHRQYEGILSIHSDYGSYGYWWSCMGCQLPEFLADIDASYLLGKISRTETDWDSAEKRLKAAVIEARKNGAKPADCREAWEAINDAFAEYSGRDASLSLYHDGSLNKVIHDWTELFTTKYQSDATQFVKQMWPDIVKAMWPVAV